MRANSHLPEGDHLHFCFEETMRKRRRLRNTDERKCCIKKTVVCEGLNYVTVE